MLARVSCRIVCIAVCILGCNKPVEPTDVKAPAPEDIAVRQTVTSLQQALKAHEAGAIWRMLDDDSQSDADRAAKAIQVAYAKASAAEKAEQEKQLGLSGAELSALTGQGFLKTKRFQGKYEELSESRITKITVQGDKATLDYTEPDGDNEKLTLMRHKGQWKVVLFMK